MSRASCSWPHAPLHEPQAAPGPGAYSPRAAAFGEEARNIFQVRRARGRPRGATARARRRRPCIRSVRAVR